MNYSLYKISKIFNVSKGVIKRNLKLYDIHIRDKGIKIEKELLWALYYGNNYTKEEIAEKIGCVLTTICAKFRKYNIPTKCMKIRIEPELLLALYHGNDYSVIQIGKIFECTSSVIIDRLNEFKILKKGNHLFAKGNKPWNNNKLGCFTDETLKKMSESRIGRFCGENSSCWVEKVQCRCNWCDMIFWINPGIINNGGGKYCSSECGYSHMSIINSGENHWNWQGGVSRRYGVNGTIKKWRQQVFKRDNWTCQECGKIGGNLCAHHIKFWYKYPDFRFDINNGQTLCKQCHLEYHKMQGFR